MQDIGLFSVTESQCTEDEHDDEDEDDSKFRNLGLSAFAMSSSLRLSRQLAQAQFNLEKARGLRDHLYYAQELIDREAAFKASREEFAANPRPCPDARHAN